MRTYTILISFHKGPRLRHSLAKPGPFYFQVFTSLLLSLLLLTGCAQLPDYAAPKIDAAAPVTDFFGYRKLTKKDFRASLPSELNDEARRHLQARSSLQIRPNPSTKIIITRSYHNSVALYWGNISDLSFGAYFIPERSWWNPSVLKKKEKYVLQHEQIHFALMELTARDINKDIQEDLEGLPIVEDSKEEVEKKIQQWITDLVNKYQTKIIAEHTKFDQDTSLFYSPKLQKKWWSDVKKRLDATRN